MSIFTPKTTNPTTNGSSSSQPSAEIQRYQKEIAALKAEVRDLETKLIASECKNDIAYAQAEKIRQYSVSLEQRIKSLEERNKRLENPKGTHYPSLSWPGKIIFCIKKMKRPLRFQEIMQELGIMERLNNTGAWLEEKTISVTLSAMGKDKRLHSEKMRGTRGNFYSLTEWLNEAGELDEKMKRKMW
jgi:hypothetical protein